MGERRRHPPRDQPAEGKPERRGDERQDNRLSQQQAGDLRLRQADAAEERQVAPSLRDRDQHSVEHEIAADQDAEEGRDRARVAAPPEQLLDRRTAAVRSLDHTPAADHLPHRRLHAGQAIAILDADVDLREAAVECEQPLGREHVHDGETAVEQARRAAPHVEYRPDHEVDDAGGAVDAKPRLDAEPELVQKAAGHGDRVRLCEEDDRVFDLRVARVEVVIAQLLVREQVRPDDVDAFPGQVRQRDETLHGGRGGADAWHRRYVLEELLRDADLRVRHLQDRLSGDARHRPFVGGRHSLVHDLGRGAGRDAERDADDGENGARLVGGEVPEGELAEGREGPGDAPHRRLIASATTSGGSEPCGASSCSLIGLLLGPTHPTESNIRTRDRRRTPRVLDTWSAGGMGDRTACPAAALPKKADSDSTRGNGRARRLLSSAPGPRAPRGGPSPPRPRSPA